MTTAGNTQPAVTGSNTSVRPVWGRGEVPVEISLSDADTILKFPRNASFRIFF